MDRLPAELYSYISKYLSPEDLLKLVLTQSYINIINTRYLFDIPVEYNKIKNSLYRDRFTNIIYRANDLNFPKNTRRLIFSDEFNFPLHKGMIPNTVTHLTFGPKFNQKLEKGVIPSSVTHLIFD